MTNLSQHFTSVLGRSIHGAAFALVLLCALTLLGMTPTQAQTYSVLHNFTGGNDGATPKAGLALDRGGNLYGTTSAGGNVGSACHLFGQNNGCGTAFRLAHSGSGWTFNPLYEFMGQTDGATPSSRVVFGPDGSLYGTALYAGDDSCALGSGCGVVYKLHPPPSSCRSVLCPWQETPIFTFQDYHTQGENPSGDLIFDSLGNIYGTTITGGSPCYVCGTVFELTPSPGGGWTETLLYNFPGTTLYTPKSGVIEQGGNLYGTATGGGMGNGGVFELLSSGSGWTEKDLYAFSFDFGENAVQGGLVIDPSNHLYGGTVSGGQTNFGIVYELADSPSGNWNETTLYNFTRATGGPYANLTLDHSGNLYGTAFGDGAYHRGSVFKLTPSPSGWIYTDLHDFDVTDGEHPVSSVLIDATGNLYGTTTAGGLYGDGVVWEITP